MAKVLVAEDDVILREIIMGKLTTAGHVAIGAEDGKRTVELAKSEKPDVILLDITLPIQDGLAALEEIRKDPSVAGTPVLVISNSDDPALIGKAKGLGVRDFFIKAIFDSSDVVEKVAALVRKKENMQTPTPTTSTNMAPTMPAGGGTNTGKRILIVEDDRFLREIATQKLEAEGYAVSSAQSGTEAIEYMSKNARPDIIVLDLILPGISGFEVLEKVKADAALKDIPVLVLSNLGQEEDIERAKKLGARDFLVKAHFSFAEIIKKIKEVIG